MHILVIDDNELDRRMLQRLFEAEGFSVTLAVDGEDGIDKFQKRPFDLVLCDIFMPKEGAIGAVRHIRSFAPEVPVIVMTAADLALEQVESVLGPVRTIFKPFRTNQLLALVEDCLR